MEWIWRERLKGEEEGVDTMQGINKVLLENLLPAHVARHFLTVIKVEHVEYWTELNGLRDLEFFIQFALVDWFQYHLLKALTQFDADNSPSWVIKELCFVNFKFNHNYLQGGGPDQLYSQKYDNICVMFASIPNYKEFYTENDINKQGLECIRLLNEIICDFDKVQGVPTKSITDKILLFGTPCRLTIIDYQRQLKWILFQLLSKPKFSLVEKIKTIGSSYMVAAGLTPGVESVAGEKLHVRPLISENQLWRNINIFRSQENSILQSFWLNLRTNWCCYWIKLIRNHSR